MGAWRDPASRHRGTVTGLEGVGTKPKLAEAGLESAASGPVPAAEIQVGCSGSMYSQLGQRPGSYSVGIPADWRYALIQQESSTPPSSMGEVRHNEA